MCPSSVLSSGRLFSAADCLLNEADSWKHDMWEENILTVNGSFRAQIHDHLQTTGSAGRLFFSPEGLSKESLKDSGWIRYFLLLSLYFLLHSERESITAITFSVCLFVIVCLFMSRVDIVIRERGGCEEDLKTFMWTSVMICQC